MKILLPGGSGQIGQVLARAFHAAGHEVVVFSRQIDTAVPWRVVTWDGATLGAWTAELEGADVLINLAGYTVNCRYTPVNRERIMASRVNSTRVLGQALGRATNPPPVWLQSSTATIYAHRFDAPNDEATGILGGHEPNAPDTWQFSIRVAQSWEAAAQETPLPRTRLVLLRSAMVMSPDKGGVFDTLLSLVRWGLGGRASHGRQFISWIHDSDFIRAIEWLIAHEEFAGVVNLAAPNPLPNAQFMATLRQAWGMPIGLPATWWMLEIGTFFLRTETELILKSRQVVPGRLQEAGFVFEFPEWEPAAEDLCGRWRT